MGKQRTSRPQAFKSTKAATSEMKAHVGEKNAVSVDSQKGTGADSSFAAGELEELVENLLDDSYGAKASQLIPVAGFPSLKLPTE